LKDLSDRCVCVVDHGLFVELAIRLSRDFGKVYYTVPSWERGFPLINDAIIGNGFDEITWVDEIWDVIDEVDLFVFPDVLHSGLQLHLESMGKRVWGSRKADTLEIRRAHLKKVQEELGMHHPKYEIVRGMANLRDYLKYHPDQYVKLSKYRGMMETFHHTEYAQTEPILDQLAVKFGSVKEVVPFLVEDPVVTDIEVGYDGYCVDGRFPSFGIQGYEVKDKSLIASVQKYEEMPEEITIVNEVLAPVLKDYRYRNFWSTEIRVKDGNSYLIDPCCRCPSPCTEIQLELWENLGEILWHGADGELIDQKVAAQFGVEAIIDHNGDEHGWRTIEVPEEIRRWVKLYNVCRVDETYAIPPFPHSCDAIGAIVGIGDTLEEAIEALKQHVEAIKDQPVSVKTESLYDAIEEIQKAEKKGLEFSDQPVPEPETVL
jgi:hypothetical protein